MLIGPMLRAYLQQPPADRALWMLFLDDNDHRALRQEIMDVLDVVQSLFMDILDGHHCDDPCSGVTVAQFTMLMDTLADMTRVSGCAGCFASC